MSSKPEKGRKRLQLSEPWAESELRGALPLPAEDANKYSRGVLTVIAGSTRYPGAACLAARAGQRMGAGYVQLVTVKRAADLALASYPSLVAREIGAFGAGELNDGKRRAVCMGPGFVPGDERTDALVADVLKKAECPVLVDGGALAGMGSKAARKALARRRKKGLVTVMTPHGGEAARLQAELGAVATAPDQLAAALAVETGAVVVVKGPDTYIAQGGRVCPMREGTPALAKAGTGDVLAGMIASLLAQGADPVAAAVLGATLHARAGAIAAKGLTEIGVTPEDVVEAVPAAILSLVGPEM